MPAPSYHLTSMTGSADPAAGIIALIEVDLLAAGWTFVEETAPFTQAAVARLMRVWKCPASLNVAVADFYVGLVRNTAAGAYFAVRAFEGWDAVAKTMQRPCIQGNVTGYTPAVSPWSAVAQGGGTWVALQNGTAISATSTDGITWTQRAMPSSQAWAWLTYANGMFFASNSSNNIYATSADGITWTQRTGPSYFGGPVAYGNGRWIATPGDGYLWMSTDAITWGSTDTPGDYIQHYGIGYGNSTFVATTGSGYIETSPTGLTGTWTNRTPPAGTDYRRRVLYGGGTWVILGNQSGTAFAATSTVATSADAITWTARTLPASVNWSGLAYGNGVFVAVAENSTIAATSTDGITWTQRAMPAGGGWFSVGFGDGLFVALGKGMASIATSTDGITWTLRTPAPPNSYAGSATQNWTLAAAENPLLVDTVPTTALVASQSYDVAVLASKSYLAIGCCLNSTSTWVFSIVAGLFAPVYTDDQATTPPLMVLRLNSTVVGTAHSGTSRAVRHAGSTTPWAVGAGPESILLGQVSGGGVKEPASASIRASRVALGGDAPWTGFAPSSGGYKGTMHDALVASGSGLKVGDQLVVGAATYTVFASVATSNFGSNPVTYAINAAAGT
ncbi:MAG TPA: hypothetical protein VK453_24290 [Micromonosporaceae bacterium]|nr:hypothetical protein [Micromonosporaceae bacterium]